MLDIIKLLVLQNNPDIFLHAAKIENNLIPDMVGKEIVVSVDRKHVPEGFKTKNGYSYTVKTVVLAQNNYNMATPFLTEFGWQQESRNDISELVSTEPVAA